MYTVKKGNRFSRPQPGCNWPNFPWTGIFKLFPAREILVSDIPAGNGKNNNLFYSAMLVLPAPRLQHAQPDQAPAVQVELPGPAPELVAPPGLLSLPQHQEPAQVIRVNLSSSWLLYPTLPLLSPQPPSS